MRYKDIIETNENTMENEPSIIDLKNFVRQVRADCRLFLSNMHGNILTRGMRKKDIILLNVPIEDVRPNPYGSSVENSMLDDEMKKSGFIARRMNAIYCFANDNRYANSQFGKNYVVFPIGDYSMTYHSTDFLDGDLGANNWLSFVRYDMDGYSIELKQKDKAAFFWQNFSKYFQQTKDLSSAASTNSEILVKASSYHAISRLYFNKIQKHFPEALSKLS